MLLKNKVVIVTGASRGIGKEISILFAREGAKVVLNYVHSDLEATSLYKEITSRGGTASLFKGDISKEDTVKELIQFTVDKYERIDILVNNAGITKDKFLINMKLNDWYEVIDTNLTAPFLTSKYALRKMMKQRYGKIINVSSLSGLSGNKGQANYAASKAGVIGLTKAIAQEYSGKGIWANAIAPGVVVTDMSKQIPESERDYKLNGILLERPGEAVEIAGVALFLASDLSNFVNGEVIRADGGIRF
ncbi:MULTISPECIES: 3-oxoacyl-ACP reductase family protein [Bacillus]|uniref:3-oxoacyl-ACP reductase family protein n=1 Tax=Bacillus TaxID=1386 RepID=UPI00111FB273|nr:MULTISPECIES: 3-oxoacyl-ACP reductase family protein [Bacillus]MEC2921436.1 3-oxoacyl-ACP reductase FabG [Bacillus tropicus]MEC2926535.1 3-oxoacyl-ACP reductase FabG [Bacillus tropicus]MEC2956128.1 3-oxoacyl-ACP reductase FabG [Bacillus tropicus]MEC3051571.1 3-oxoacyl-ACP reductase FabG [Bacillus tropicus]MEC3078006.1 3-oxoacyl-ACP reductase FabG [Bacillus tropicus]